MLSASADVVATCEPGSGDTTDRVWGNHLTQPLRARSPTAATIVTSSGLCRHAAWMTIDDATPLTASSGPWSPTTPQSARSTVIGTPCTRSRPSSAPDASARRSSSPPRGSSGVNDVGSDPSPVRSTRKSGLSRLRAQRSTVRSSARRASSARSGAVRTRSMRSASTSASSSPRHSTMRSRYVASSSRNRLRPDRLSSTEVATITSGDINVSARNCTCCENANNVRPAASGASTASTLKPRWSPRSGIGPSSGGWISDTTGGRYGVRWNSIWPSWSRRSPSARTNRRNDNRLPPRAMTSVSRVTVGSAIRRSLTVTPFCASASGVIVTVQSTSTVMRAWRRDTVGSVSRTSASSSRPSSYVPGSRM